MAKSTSQPKLPLLTADEVRFGDARFLHPKELRALAWIDGRALSVAGDKLTLWSPDGERLQTLPLGEHLPTYGDLRFFPTRAPGRVVLGPGDVLCDAPFIRLSWDGERLAVEGTRAHGVSTDVSYYLDAIDLGEAICLAHGAGVRRLPWDGSEATELVESPLSGKTERGAALSPDGALVAFSAYPKAEVVLLDLASGERLHTLSPTKVHGTFGPKLRFTDDGAQLITAYSKMYRTAAELWSVATGERTQELVAHVGTGEVMQLQQAGELLLLRQAGVDLLAWDLKSGQLAWSRKDQGLPALLTSTDEGLLIASGHRLIPLSADDGAPTQPSAGLNGPATSLTADPRSGRLLACASQGAALFEADGRVVEGVDAYRVRHIPGGEEALLERSGRGHGKVELERYALASGERRPLLSGAYKHVQHDGGLIAVVDSYFSRAPKRARALSPKGKELAVLGRGHPDIAAGSPDGARLLAAKGTRFTLYAVEGGDTLWDLKKALAKAPSHICFSPDSARFAAACPEQLRVFDGASDEALLTQPLDGAVRALRWLDDARLIAVTEKGTVSLIGPADALERRGLGAPLSAAHLAEDGQLYACTADGALQRFDLSGWLGLDPVAPEPQREGFLALGPLADAAGDALHAALEAADWGGFEPARDLPPLRALLTALEAREGVGPAHKLAAARLLAREDSALQHRFGHEEKLGSFALSADGRLLATGSWTGSDYERGGTLQIWEVATGRCVNILDPIEGGVGWPDYGACAKWSPDGSRVGLAYNTNCVGSFLPFEEGAVVELEACVTNGWSRPPAWCWGPDSRSLVVFCWGSSPIPGCVVPEGAGFAAEDDARWFGPALPEGVDAEALQPPVAGVWTPDGARIQGHSKHGQAYAVDPKTREMSWCIEASAPAAWSPDGRRFAHSGSGVQLHDAADGAQLKGFAVSKPSAMAWSPDSRQLAVVLRDGVTLLREDGPARHIPGSPAEQKWDFPDGQAWAFSPDGARGAMMETGGVLSVWALEGEPRQLARVELGAEASGVLFGEGVVITTSPGRLDFRDADELGLIARFEPGSPREDLLEEPSPLVKGKVDAAARYLLNPAFPMKDGEAHRWVVAFPEGVVICPEALQPRLPEELALVVARRFALPLAWLQPPTFDSLSDAAGCEALPLSAAEKKALIKAKPKAKKKAPGKGKELPLGEGPLTLLTDAWWDSVKGLGRGWQSHISEYLCKQSGLLLRAGEAGGLDRAAALDKAAQAVIRIPEDWWRVVAFAQGARLLAEAGQTEAAEGWLSQAEALEADAVDQWNSTSVCGALAAANHALGHAEKVAPLLARAAEHVADEANPFQRYASLADAQWRCGLKQASLDTLRAGPWSPGWVPHMLTPYVVRRLHEELDAGIELLDLIEDRAGKINEFDLSDALVDALIAAGRVGEVPARVKRFKGLSTHHYLERAVEALRAAGRLDDAKRALAEAIAESAEWPASQVRWAPPLIEVDRAAGEALTLALLERGAALAKSYYPGEALGHLAHALAALGQVDAAQRLGGMPASDAHKRQVLLGALRGAPDDPGLLADARARLPGATPKPRDQVKALAELAVVTTGPVSEALEAEAIAAAKAAPRGEQRWVTDELVNAAVRAERWQFAWRSLFVVPKSKRQYNMMHLVDALAKRGQAQAVLTLAEQQGTKDLNDRPSTLWRAIERFPAG